MIMYIQVTIVIRRRTAVLKQKPMRKTTTPPQRAQSMLSPNEASTLIKRDK